LQNATCLLLTLLLCGTGASAQVPDEDWDFEDGYQTQMLYLHSLVNYAYDLEWQYEWERRQFAGNALRVNTGSVSSDELLTDVELNITQPLNEKWRFMGRFTRDGLRWRPVREEQLLLGLERSTTKRPSTSPPVTRFTGTAANNTSVLACWQKTLTGAPRMHSLVIRTSGRSPWSGR